VDQRLKGRVRTLVGIAAACGAGLWLAATPIDAGATSKVEVRLVEVGYVLGQGGMKVRLSLATGQAVEFHPEDARDADALLRMTEMFVSGRARMFAELDGSNVVRAVQIAGPGYR
jgi:hypothetical protein